MRIPRLPGSITALSLAALALDPCPAGARITTTPTSLVESRLDGGTILNTQPQKLVSAVRDSASANPRQTANIVAAVLNGGRADTDAIAPQVTAAAIQGLGDKPSPPDVQQIVFASVKAAPAVVLETVRSAVKAAPSCAKAIVKAAIMAIPDPKDKIQPVAENPAPETHGYTKDESKESAVDAAQTQELLPIAEAIAKAAAMGDPGLSYQDLLTAANEAVSVREDGGFNTTSVYTGYYYPPLLNVNAVKQLRPGMPSPPVVSK